MEKQLVISSVLSNLNMIEIFLDQIFDEFSISRSIYFPVLLSLNESVQNSIVHGNKNDAQKKVVIRAILNHKKLKFLVEDQGNGFDMNLIPDPTLPENICNESGRGLFLICKLADEVNLLEQGRILEIKFKVHREYKFF